MPNALKTHQVWYIFYTYYLKTIFSLTLNRLLLSLAPSLALSLYLCLSPYFLLSMSLSLSLYLCLYFCLFLSLTVFYYLLSRNMANSGLCFHSLNFKGFLCVECSGLLLCWPQVKKSFWIIKQKFYFTAILRGVQRTTHCTWTLTLSFISKKIIYIQEDSWMIK